ncbi:MAG: Gfo/Idh/MocA family oxidoreductase [Treponema sp.]|jgi:predicted dehydrogenase|nr:Gfo/Idh/MocA family oxidoreductase [Treponema sp.]
MMKVRLGIIGIGNMGTAHVKIITEGRTPDIELAAVADSAPQRRSWAAQFLGADFPVYESGSELIRKSGVDAVLIAVPHYHHPSLTIEAFSAGMHVLCEKPAGVYTKQVREMNEAAAKSGKVFAMMFNQRTNSCYRKMRELVTGGSLGAVVRTSWIITNWFRTEAYYTSGGWRGTWDGEGGGVLLNQCPHQLDMFQWICGMPVRVRAFCHYGKWHNIEVEDDVTAYLEYPNGATGTFITSTGEAPGTNRFEISMEKGKIVNDGGSDVTVYRLSENMREFSKTSKEGFASPECIIEKPEIEDDNPQHAGILRSFAGRILRGEPLIAEGVEGINGLILSNAMHLSSWLDKTVEIPFNEELFLSELGKRWASSNAKTGSGPVFDTEGSY